jgi:alpha-galactosidase
MNATGIETDPAAAGTAATESVERILHVLHIPVQHLRLTQVELQDGTDNRNELVQEREWLLHTAEVGLALPGNLFCVEDMITGSGWIIVKTLPLPHARPNPSPADLRVARLATTGFEVSVVTSDPDESSRDTTVLTYGGGAYGRTRALHAFQQAQRPETAGHFTPRFLSNTWGDRNRDSRVCESFLLAEIEAAARLGVDIVQIDDGWQQGTTINSAQAQELKGVWQGFRSANPEFWKPHVQRFPRGLEPVVQAARARGLGLGLWFAPDSAQDFAHWELDAETVLGFHRTLGIEHFKIDGVQAGSRLGMENLRRFFDRVLTGSDGRIVLDLDVTAGVRPGYFGALPTGPLFVENRYTDWHRYWPHQTLRNLWKLSRWVDPRRLRMEWLNHARHRELYPEDPLAPACYPPDALFATVMFSNPLGWFEVSNLPEGYFAQAAPLVQKWRAARARLFNGVILPLGEAPDGFAWTGFVSVQGDGRSCDLLVFRELNPARRHVFHTPGFHADGCRIEVVAGSGTAAGATDGITVEIPHALGYLWIRAQI